MSMLVRILFHEYMQWKSSRSPSCHYLHVPARRASKQWLIMGLNEGRKASWVSWCHFKMLQDDNININMWDSILGIHYLLVCLSMSLHQDIFHSVCAWRKLPGSCFAILHEQTWVDSRIDIHLSPTPDAVCYTCNCKSINTDMPWLRSNLVRIFPAVCIHWGFWQWSKWFVAILVIDHERFVKQNCGT